jgi:ABC-type glutathione transport system ATPase component
MRCLRSYPHEFSGGMRQRAMMAMALACHPRVLLADEPTTALDATIQAQILTLLRDLQRARALAIVLITHALGIVAQTADVVCVMYAGRVVEYARVLDLFDRPLHPYTRGLLACIPSLASPRDRLATVREFVDDPARFALKDRPGLHAWWPAHRPPDAVRSRANGESEYRLVEIEPGRWLGLWNTPEAHALPASFPNLPPLSAQTVAIGAR